MSVCSACNKKLVIDVLNSCCKILSTYEWLIDSYVLDFFTENLWNKLPLTWQEVLLDVEPEELGLWLDQNKIPKFRRPWPLSLLALRSSIHRFSIPRKNYCVHKSNINTENIDPSANVTSENAGNFNQLYEISKDCMHTPGNCKHLTFINQVEKNINCGDLRPQHSGCIRAFKKHVKPKKRHEIFKMAKVVCEWADKMGVKQVVDVGSGLGHLARLLTYGHNLSTCCIESQHNLSIAARKLDEEIKYTLSKYLTKEEHELLLQPYHITYNLGPNIDSSNFLKLVLEAFQHEKSNKSDETVNMAFGIVGLHPCGDLAAILLQLFNACPQACFICIAGCCYMKLTPGRGFPLSQYVIESKEDIRNLQLSYEAREMACHAIEIYSKNLLSEKCSQLKIHCFRATLESIIAKNWPHLRRSGLKSIKYTEGLQFSEYARLALTPLGLTPPAEDLLNCTTISYLNMWRHVVAFYSLRLMFAPLVETFLLYDRLLYLSEKGVPCRITPEFDPEISPRNHLLIGIKPWTRTSEDVVRKCYSSLKLNEDT